MPQKRKAASSVYGRTKATKCSATSRPGVGPPQSIDACHDVDDDDLSRQEAGETEANFFGNAADKRAVFAERNKSPVNIYNPNDYTVGWICAIYTEYVAAQCFLDEEHDGPEAVANKDNNDYTLGRIGKHNVVIAVLPDGEYGTSPAAMVASYMLNSFPNVRVGLMVGIGGGAPSQRHDIRLGDIVVSSPCNGEGGIFQYDFGKTLQGQSFKATGVLNQPPQVLRTAVSGLRAQYERKGHQLEEAIDSVLDKNSRLLQKYKRPNPAIDRLYKADVVHSAASQESCVITCPSHPSTLTLREERAKDGDNPVIHYGLIASANQLMQDALVRNKLAEEKDVLCFEMEAAGLMNHFPCLVIRGICDYSDSHKNKQWQGFAAMAAAAYARDLLCRIPPNKVEAEKTIRDVLTPVQKHVHEIRGHVEDLVFEQKRSHIDDWLSAPDSSTNLIKATKQRQESTGLWFLHMDKFATWKAHPRSILWLYGMPGCGKTILSSSIIEHLEPLTSQPLLYFFFDFNDAAKQSLESLVCGLISQLYWKRTDARQPLDSIFSSCDQGRTRPSCELLCKTLMQMIDQAKEVWIVLDALDECSIRKGHATKGLLSWITDLVNSEQRNVHLLVTSRQEHDIEAGLSGLLGQTGMVPIQSDLINDDIHAYVVTRVKQSDELERWRNHPEIQEEIETELMRKANGMFRWVACQIDALESCLDYPSLTNVLKSLPKTLDETYRRILQSIPSEHKQAATRILQFLTYSERPLKIVEVIDAIAVNVKEQPHFNPKYRMPEPAEITRYCSSLVVSVPTKGAEGKQDTDHAELQLAHFSVKEYLTSDRLPKSFGQDMRESIARESVAKVCLAYLLHLNEDISLKKVLEDFPLAKYSARFSARHTRVGSCEEDELLILLERLFCSQDSSYDICFNLYRPDEYFQSEYKTKPALALYYAAFLDMRAIVKLLLEKGVFVDAQGGYYANALQAASFRGHEQIVKLLLDKGADVNAQGGRFGNALPAASYNGHEQIVKLLLHKGADVNAQGGDYGDTLPAASYNGHEQIVKLLLEKGADVNAQGGDYGDTLPAASYNGHEQIVKLLLEKGADVNAKGGYYGNALPAASYKGHEQIVKLLLDKGADVNAKDGRFGNALQVASFGGHEQIAKLLLEKGANVDVQGGRFGNALQAASYNGHEQIVKLLLDKGADVNAKGGDFGNALPAASYNGHEQIVKLLLEKDGNEVGKQNSLASKNLAISNEPTVDRCSSKRVSRICPRFKDGFGRK